MKSAETSVITVSQGDFVIHMSITDKQSNSGLIFNERLMVLNQGFFFGYISKFDLKEDPNKIDLKKIKLQVPIKCIKAIDHDKENLIIKFIHIEQNKQQPKRWVFKMVNQQMVDAWFRLLQQEKAKRANRSSQKKSRSRGGTDQFSPPKAQKPVQKRSNKSASEQVLPSFRNSNIDPEFKQKKKQPQKIIEQEESQNRQFVNPLYTGYDSRDSELANNVAKNAKQLQTPNNNNLPSPPHRKQSVSPKRQNNLMKQKQSKHGKNKQNRLIQQIYEQRKQVQKNNLQFKNEPLKGQIQYQQKQQNVIRKGNNLFNKKPRSSYVEMIQKIVKQSQQKTIQKQRQRLNYDKQNFRQQNNEQKQKHLNTVLQQFIRYDIGQTQRWRQQNLKQNYQNIHLQRQQKQIKQLQQLQKYVIDIQKQHRNNLKLQQLSPRPINYTDFSKQIAIMLRNKRFERQGHQQLSPQKQSNPQQYNIKNMPFSYRYLQATSPSIPINQRQQDIMQVLADWKIHCQNIMKQLITDIVLQQGKFKLKVKKNNILYYQLDQIQIKIATAQLKIVHFKGKNNQNNQKIEKKQQQISDYSSAKDLQIQFKNYSALNQLLQKSQLSLQLFNNQKYSNQKNIHHSSKLKVPLTALAQYHGFIALFKLNPKFSYKQNDINQQYILEKQSIISQISNIEVNWLQQSNGKNKGPRLDEDFTSNKTLVLHIDQNYYAQLHLQRNQKKSNKNQKTQKYKKNIEAAQLIFAVDFLQQINSFLLKDYLTKSLANGVLRKQLIEQMTAKDQYKNKMFTNPQKITNPSSKSKLEADLTLFSGEVLQKLSGLILKLDNLSFFYLHPEQLSDFFHKQGVNIRYMGLAFDNLSEPYAKKLLMTEIATRVSKLLLRKTIQDVLLQSQHTGNKSSSPVKNSRISSLTRKGQIDITNDVTDFLNCILGSSQQSIAIWNVLSQHAQYYFKCEIKKEFIDPGYFITSLAYHCKLNVNWKGLNDINSVFQKEDFFSKQTIIGLNTQIKTYEPFSSKIYNNLKNLMTLNKESEDPHQQLFQKLVSEFKLTTDQLPYCLSCLPNSSPFSVLSMKQFLSQFIRPQTIKLSSSESNFGHLRVFNDLNECPQKKIINIKISQIKWYLRLKKKQKYLKKFQELINLLNKFYGDFSPALGQLYDVFANFHMSNGQYEDAITFSKSSLVNRLKICGTNHLKTAQSYYNLSLCYLKANKTEDAYNLLKKSKIIYESKQRVNTRQYASINLKLGILMLNKNQIKECILSVQKALQTFDEVQQIQQQESNYLTKKSSINYKTIFQAQKSECYQTLARCYELSHNNANFKTLSLKMQQKFLNTIQSSSNLQKMLRIIIAPYFHSLASQQAVKYIEIISSLSTVNPIQLSPKTYNRAFQLIIGRIKENSLMNNLESYLQNFASIADYISINNTLKTWKPFEQKFQRETINDFVSINEELLHFLGQGYLSGVLRQVVQNASKR